MIKKEAKTKLITYLKEHNICFQECLSDGESCILIVLPGWERCPDSVLECSIYFFKKCMECRVYYTESAAQWISERADNLNDIYRLLNFIQARVWPFTQDGVGRGLYSAHHLNTPRFYITEDGYNDLTSTTVIDYDIFEMAPIETADYITAALPELMDKLSTPLFFVLLNKMTVEEGMDYIKKEILEEAC